TKKPRGSLLSALRGIFPANIQYWRTLKQDLWLYAMNNVILALFATLLIPITSNYYRDWAAPKVEAFLTLHFGRSIAPATNGFWPDLIYTLGILIAGDLGRYFAHRCAHRFPTLWEFHKVHHSARSLNPMAFFRQHFVDIVFTQSIMGVSMGLSSGITQFVFGLTPSIVTLGGVAVFSGFFAVTGVLRHSHIWWSYGKLEYVFTSPAMHLIHHSASPEHFDKNFGSDFMIWDLIFGTIYFTEKKPIANLKFGVRDHFDWENASPWQYIWHPLTEGAKIAFKRNRPAASLHRIKRRESNRKAA
ncbi:MAG: sterol desaturase family protein, partial [Bdellovibrio sp.]|nr:sterol desaturase family protein [Bdellovibrio sp.]